MNDAAFYSQYAAALHSYLAAEDEASLAVGYDLGRQALQGDISMLEIIENHSRLVSEYAKTSPPDLSAALQFLLQTLAPLDVATRGFLDGAKRYEQERARADDLANRDEFRTALVNSLQEGFFVADHNGAVVEVNDAFAEITGYGASGLPYRWPHPWVLDENGATERFSQLQREARVGYEIQIRHRDGRIVWVGVNMNAVSGTDRDTYVGTIRDVTAARAAADTARETSLTLQRAMLAPMQTPAGFAVRYEPAVTPLEIGGDWYDVLRLGDHRIGIIVGDCVGRGLAAAAVMGQLRSSARALLLAGAEPALLLEQLDAVADLIPGAYCTTVMAAVFDPFSRLLTYSRAGHVPAVLAAPDSAAEVLSGAGSVPLAVNRNHRRPQASAVLAPCSTVMLFTDGLVERRGESIDAGIARVADVLTHSTNLAVDALAEEVLQEMTPPDGYDDDVAIVICRPPLVTLRIENDAAPDQLAGIRKQLTTWLRETEVPEDLVSDVVLAVGEACTNCVEHAYRARPPGAMRIEAEVDRGEIRIRVVDFGSWRTPESWPRTGGRGLMLMRALSDVVHLDSTGIGTTVAMSFRRPAG